MRTSLAPALLAALLILALALAPRADAFIYWSSGQIGRANLDGTGVDKRFITAGRSPYGVAVDAEHVYWANWKPRAIGRANLDGTGVDKNFIATERKPYGVAVDAEHVYWSTGGPTIGRANLDGTGVDPSFITGAGDPVALAVDAAHLYWANFTFTPIGSEFYGSTIGRANLDGTGVDDSFIAGAGSHFGVAVDASHVYWTADDPCDLLRVTDNAPTGQVAGGNAGPPCGNAIGRANLDGTGVEQSFIPTLAPGPEESEPVGVAVDAEHVYWTNYSGFLRRWQFIGRANLDGTDGERFITGVGGPGAVAVDALRSFSFGKVKKNKRKGTAKLAVKVPGPGALKLAKTRSVKRAKKRAEAKGKAKLSVRPKGKAKQKLAAKGKATVKAKVTYTPRGGDPTIVRNTDTKTVKLIKR